MVKKTVGYVELEWICPKCGTRNPGPQKTCTNCGSPQPDNVEFQQTAQEELITDEARLAQAKAGADIHCAYCGTRNPATAKTCSQCGALLEEGQARQQGQVLGAHRRGPAKPIICPSCSTENAPDADKCTNCGASLADTQPKPKAAPQPETKRSPMMLIGCVAVVAVALVCGLFLFFANRTEDASGRVEAVEWQREIHVEGLVPVEREDWEEELPDGADVGQCSLKAHHTQDEPADNAKEICGTPYTVDQGNGTGQVVQDCKYEVSQNWCEYTIPEWQEVDVLSISGDDLEPEWPELNLTANQREGEQEETYRCIFTTEEGERTYTTDDLDDFLRCEIGSRWTLEVNTFNNVQSITPAE